MSFTPIEKTILRLMHSRKIYGAHHKRIETIMRSGFPKHLHGEVKKAIDKLIRKELIRWYNKSAKAIQLNKEKYKKIKTIIN